MHAYALCGWHVASDVALPGVTGWAGEAGAPDIRIARGPVPARLETPVLNLPTMQVDAAGRVRFEVPGVLACLIERGTDVTVATDAPDEAATFLTGSVLGILCHQRGVLPVKAAAVEIGGRAVLLAGATGTGKSVLAAAFLRRGFAVLGDDVTLLSGDGVAPGPARLRLWRRSVEALGWDIAAMTRCRAGLEKYARALEARGPAAPHAIVHLRDHPAGIELRALSGREAFAAFHRSIYRARTLAALVGPEAAMARVQAGAGRVSHYELSRPLRYDGLDASVDAILDAVERTA
jgi:hypothetical protein